MTATPAVREAFRPACSHRIDWDGSAQANGNLASKGLGSTPPRNGRVMSSATITGSRLPEVAVQALAGWTGIGAAPPAVLLLATFGAEADPQPATARSSDVSPNLAGQAAPRARVKHRRHPATRAGEADRRSSTTVGVNAC